MRTTVIAAALAASFALPALAQTQGYGSSVEQAASASAAPSALRVLTKQEVLGLIPGRTISGVNANGARMEITYTPDWRYTATREWSRYTDAGSWSVNEQGGIVLVGDMSATVYIQRDGTGRYFSWNTGKELFIR